MYEAFRSLRKDASAGIDGVTYEQYGAHAEENLRQLHQRLKEGKYQVQPLRRVYIPKEDGKQRPISIPALEDKLVQKGVGDLLGVDPKSETASQGTKYIEWSEVWICPELSTVAI
jgi:retron-type reverse transcriptase